MPNSNSEYWNFYNYLTETYPISNCPKIVMTFQQTIIVASDGRTGFGMASFSKDIVELFIVTERHKLLVLKTIAHEYRHIMQRHINTLKSSTVLVSVQAEERDANLFGEHEVRSYRKRAELSKQDGMKKIVSALIESGKSRMKSNEDKNREYKEHIGFLKLHFSNISCALTELYGEVTKHYSFPRCGNIPLSQRESRDYEINNETGGIATGFNRFQGWARKHYSIAL